MAGTGEYYEIDLFRRTGNETEMTVIGVGLQGQVVSYRYRMGNQWHHIRQFNGLDTEALAEQMVEQSDPPWTR